MRTEKQAKEESMLIVTLLMCGAALSFLITATGCAGVELGGRLGLYRVDTKQDSSATVISQTKPILCYFKDCTKEEISHGS